MLGFLLILIVGALLLSVSFAYWVLLMVLQWLAQAFAPQSSATSSQVEVILS